MGSKPPETFAREPFRSARSAETARLAEGWLVARYERLLAYPHWRESLSLHPRSEFPPYADIFDAQRLYLLQQWQLAQAAEATPERLAEALQRDLVFWRRTLGEADSLITKMVAATAIRSHFQWASALQASLPPAAQAAAIPPVWQRPLDETERSMRRALAGEALMMDAPARRIAAGESVQQLISDTGEETDWLQSLARTSAALLLQPQDMSNRRDGLLLALADELEVEPGEFPAALERATAMEDRAMEEVFDNPFGSLLLAVASPQLSDYASRVFDLEGVRRAALLAANLRGEGVEPTQMPAALAAAALRDPYTGQAFAWDAAGQVIVFDGVSEGECGQNRIPY